MLMASRDSFRQMMDSITTPFSECVDYLVKNIELDVHFKEYLDWALENEIPTVILSGGMRPVVTGILKNAIGDDVDKIDIICNEAEARPGMSIEHEAGWQITYHDERCGVACATRRLSLIFTAGTAMTSP